MFVLSAVALAPIAAQGIPTPAPVTPITVGDALNAGISVIQMLGIFAFISIMGFLAVAFYLYKRARRTNM